MRTLLASLALALAAGCAALEPRPAPLDEAQIVRLARAGESGAAIVARLEASGTVLALSASDIVRLHGEGVPAEVLDWLQRAQLIEVRRRATFSVMHGYGPFGRGVGCSGTWAFERPIGGHWPFC